MIMRRRIAKENVAVANALIDSRRKTRNLRCFVTCSGADRGEEDDSPPRRSEQQVNNEGTEGTRCFTDSGADRVR